VDHGKSGGIRPRSGGEPDGDGHVGGQAGQRVTQPGDYNGQLALRTNSPYPVNPIAVTMHVLAPAT
jgi:hypothetical protein